MAEKPHGTMQLVSPCLRYMVCSYLVLASAFSLWGYFYYRNNTDGRIAKIETYETQQVGFYREIILREFEDVIGDIRFLSDHNEIRAYLENPSDTAQQSLANEYARFAEEKRVYDQVRFLDMEGMEVVRVNFATPHVEIVPTEQLQPKGDRYYFRESVRLPSGEVYISPLDLNIENDVIEQPLKPMIRFGVAVHDRRGRKRGVVVLNYKAEAMLSMIDHAAAGGDGELMLFNSEGYWMLDTARDTEWGWLIAERSGARFDLHYPDAWKQLSGRDAGCLETRGGLFMFDRLSLKDTGSRVGVPVAVSDGGISHHSSEWTILAHLPRQALTAMRKEFLMTLLPPWLGVMLLLLIPAWAIGVIGNWWRRYRAELEKKAYFDKVTGLATRTLFLDRLAVACRQAERYSRIFAVMFLDLDGFKAVNDSHGHDAGDEVLKNVGERLKSCVRDADTVARMGGDEFTIILTEMTGARDAAAVAEKVLAVVQQPIHTNGQDISVGASVGISLYPADGKTPEDLITRADEAMYSAKQAGKGCYRYANPPVGAIQPAESTAV